MAWLTIYSDNGTSERQPTDAVTPYMYITKFPFLLTWFYFNPSTDK